VHSHPRILVVNDDEDALFLLHRTILRECPDAAVTGLRSAGDALAFLETQQVDAIVTDNQMPGMDGLAMVHAIRARDPATIILMLTGSDQVKGAALNAGVNSFVSTGSWSEIRIKIRELLHVR
jgi:two-component system response regulator GlrR